MAIEQIEFTSRRYVTYVTDRNRTILSESIRLSDLALKLNSIVDDSLRRQLDQLACKHEHRRTHAVRFDDDQRQYVDQLSVHCTLMTNYVNYRLEQIDIQMKTIEHILPIIGKCAVDDEIDRFFSMINMSIEDEQYDDISNDRIEYR
jgi:hypothetical protein